MDRSAADFFSGISGRLRSKIIPSGIKDDEPADYLIRGEPCIIKCSPGITVVAKKRRHVAGVQRIEEEKKAMLDQLVQKLNSESGLRIRILGGFR